MHGAKNKKKSFSWLAEKLLASEELCSMELVSLCLFLFPIGGGGGGEFYIFQKGISTSVLVCRPMVCFLESVSYLVRGLRHVPAACVITSAVSSLPSFWEFRLLFTFFFLGGSPLFRYIYFLFI